MRKSVFGVNANLEGPDQSVELYSLIRSLCSTMPNYSISGQRRRRSDCAYAQSDLRLRCPHMPEAQSDLRLRCLHMPEDTFSIGTAHLLLQTILNYKSKPYKRRHTILTLNIGTDRPNKLCWPRSAASDQDLHCLQLIQECFYCIFFFFFFFFLKDTGVVTDALKFQD